MEKETRITIDLDTRSINALIRCLNALAINGFDLPTVRLSSSKKGYHVIAWNTRKMNNTTLDRIRLLAGDDVKRVMWDRKKNRERQVLFTKKKLKRVRI